MHPAFSVIFFTTASGAGYGLLMLLGFFAASGVLPPDRWLGFVGLGLSVALFTAGLLSSTFHLGHPERSWRAFTQWRSSWLSREGVMAVITYVPTGLFGIGWVFFETTSGAVAAAGVIAGVCAILTLVTTGMIYASLKPIAQWHSVFTMPGYIVYGIMTGSVLASAIAHAFGVASWPVTVLPPAMIAMGWAWKIATWRYNDTHAAKPTPASALGLPHGEVRSVEWPHTEENYLLHEMGFRIGRKHAAKLRRITHVLCFAAPLGLSLLALVLGGWPATACAVLAVLAQAPGILAERWLFFAEAKHTVTLYYGVKAA